MAMQDGPLEARIKQLTGWHTAPDCPLNYDPQINKLKPTENTYITLRMPKQMAVTCQERPIHALLFGGWYFDGGLHCGGGKVVVSSGKLVSSNGVVSEELE